MLYLAVATILRLVGEEVSPISGRRIRSKERTRILHAATLGGCGLKELVVVGSMGGKAVTLYKWRRKKEVVCERKKQLWSYPHARGSVLITHWLRSDLREIKVHWTCKFRV
jgi:hypothetical protein